jgi:hypothetical protein
VRTNVGAHQQRRRGLLGGAVTVWVSLHYGLHATVGRRLKISVGGTTRRHLR